VYDDALAAKHQQDRKPIDVAAALGASVGRIEIDEGDVANVLKRLKVKAAPGATGYSNAYLRVLCLEASFSHPNAHRAISAMQVYALLYAKLRPPPLVLLGVHCGARYWACKARRWVAPDWDRLQAPRVRGPLCVHAGHAQGHWR
jgi:hypothetical protein